jgi:membrane protease YdiL (CAAX protease family)
MMNRITSLIRRYPQATFWAIAWSTWLFGWVMASRYPSDLWYLFIYGPFLTGAFVTWIADGRPGLRTYFSRMVRWRVGVVWYAVALLLPPAVKLAAAGLNVISGATVSPDFQLPPVTEIVVAFIFPSFLLIALGEEPGFRGFALPRLLIGRSALAASLILGVLHAIWHIPVIVYGSDTPLVILIVISGAILNTWLFNHTNGSVLLAMLLHASLDVTVGIFNPMFAGAASERYLIWQTILFVVIGILLPVLTGRELGRQSARSKPIAAAEQPATAR